MYVLNLTNKDYKDNIFNETEEPNQVKEYQKSYVRHINRDDMKTDESLTKRDIKEIEEDNESTQNSDKYQATSDHPKTEGYLNCDGKTQ